MSQCRKCSQEMAVVDLSLHNHARAGTCSKSLLFLFTIDLTWQQNITTWRGTAGSVGWNETSWTNYIVYSLEKVLHTYGTVHCIWISLVAILNLTVGICHRNQFSNRVRISQWMCFRESLFPVRRWRSEVRSTFDADNGIVCSTRKGFRKSLCPKALWHRTFDGRGLCQTHRGEWRGAWHVKIRKLRGDTCWREKRWGKALKRCKEGATCRDALRILPGKIYEGSFEERIEKSVKKRVSARGCQESLVTNSEIVKKCWVQR